jgi:hypothetical protein
MDLCQLSPIPHFFLAFDKSAYDLRKLGQILRLTVSFVTQQMINALDPVGRELQWRIA